MDDSTTPRSVATGVDLNPHGPPEVGTHMRWRPGLDEADYEELNRARADKSAIVEDIPVEDSSLGAFSVACLIFNRTIGSGIFNSPAVVFYNTQSIGGGILLWLYGALTALSGLVLYIELGLTVPRWTLQNGQKISTPRSGAELVYFNYFLKVPKYLATCLFGISFLVFGNTATNCVAFAVAVLQAAHTRLDSGRIVGVAIAVNTVACLLHSMSRKLGIYFNNLLGTAKLLMLFVMILLGLRYMDRSVSGANYSTETSFSRTPLTPSGVYRYAEGIAFVIFPFCGFNQANYVLAEIREPRKNFARTATVGVSLLCVLYFWLNCLYAAIIPRDVLLQPDRDIPLEYFSRTVGRGGSPEVLSRVASACGALRAISALGNVIVFTFTVAKVKQEAAKEGVLPFSLYIASSYDFSLRRGWRIFRRLPDHKADHRLHSAKTPAAALLLHWTVTTLLIVAAVAGTAQTVDGEAGNSLIHLPGYSLLAMAYTYGLDLIWFTVIGVGMLRLRLWPGSTWRGKSPVPHWLGVSAAAFFTLANAFPLIALWIPDLPDQPDLARSNGRVPWFASQTTSLAILGFAFLYWVGFRFYLRQRKARHGEELVVARHPVFKKERAVEGSISRGSGDHEWGVEEKFVLLYEIIRLQWREWVPETEMQPVDFGQTQRAEDVVSAEEEEAAKWNYLSSKSGVTAMATLLLLYALVILALAGVAIYEHLTISHLSLPISPAVTILTILLPLLAPLTTLSTLRLFLLEATVQPTLPSPPVAASPDLIPAVPLTATP
ncbi:hypothetical protein VTJ49DRAFT_2233 [Mycothermus thermophilus]|uniref:High-affinity methionine permease n=1 Tax=Humicola insolens TaxID=85995 RepID=A0ABR3VBK9_HUMIN